MQIPTRVIAPLPSGPYSQAIVPRLKSCACAVLS
jgi:hypothetical protein